MKFHEWGMASSPPTILFSGLQNWFPLTQFVPAGNWFVWSPVVVVGPGSSLTDVVVVSAVVVVGAGSSFIDVVVVSAVVVVISSSSTRDVVVVSAVVDVTVDVPSVVSSS